MTQDTQARVNVCARVIVPGIPHFAAGNGGRIPHLSPMPSRAFRYFTDIQLSWTRIVKSSQV